MNVRTFVELAVALACFAGAIWLGWRNRPARGPAVPRDAHTAARRHWIASVQRRRDYDRRPSL